MISFVYLFAALWAVASVHQTGNYTRIRVYLYVMVADAVVTGAVAWKFGVTSDMYLRVYFICLTAVCIAALMVARGALKLIPGSVSLGSMSVVVGIAFGLMSWQWYSLKDPYSAAFILEAVMVSIAGMVAWVCSTADTTYRAPLRTLGSLWLVQMGFFYVYAAGLTLNAGFWQSIGEWMPPTITSIALMKLGRDFKSEPLVPVVARG